jgi:hypothetical protein
LARSPSTTTGAGHGNIRRSSAHIRLISHINGTASVRVKVDEENVYMGGFYERSTMEHSLHYASINMGAYYGTYSRTPLTPLWVPIVEHQLHCGFHSRTFEPTHVHGTQWKTQEPGLHIFLINLEPDRSSGIHIGYC